jgi:hypothetical protein
MAKLAKRVAAFPANSTSSGLVHWSLGNSWWATEHYSNLAIFTDSFTISRKYLESASQTVYTVICLFGWQTFESELDNVVFFGKDVIGPAEELGVSPSIRARRKVQYCSNMNLPPN